MKNSVSSRVKMSVWFSFKEIITVRFFPSAYFCLIPFARKYDRDDLVVSCDALSYVHIPFDTDTPPSAAGEDFSRATRV